MIRKFANKLGFDIVRFIPEHAGKNPFVDMRTFLHDDQPVIFDVGANLGQSIQRFNFVFPEATIHSFEPSPTTFDRLVRQAADIEGVHLWNFALGASPGEMTFLENSHSDMSSFLPLSDLGWGEITKETPVEVRTIDAFIEQEAIERIDILKSDTQGFDLEVFKGAERAMAMNRIGLIYFEIIFAEQYQQLPSFSEIFEFLTQRDFKLVSFYKIYYQRKLAGWTDALFVHTSYIR